MVLIIKKWTAILLSLSLLLSLSPRADAEGRPTTHARCALLMGADGTVIVEQNARQRSLIASTTKLMTALVALERADLEEEVTITPAQCRVEGSSMYLRPGLRCTVGELVTGLLLASGNDAALALAEHIAGSVEDFVRLMNEQAQELGLEDTHFMNPHGLDEQGHYSTALDLARLMAVCMENPAFARIAALRQARIAGVDYYNHNKLLTLCPGCLGGKTGYTQAAGRCLVSCCEREGTRLICVTLSDPQDWRDHQLLYAWGFANYAARELPDELRYTLPLVSGTQERVDVAAEPFKLLLPRDAAPIVEVELPPFVFAPVEAGEAAGRATLRLNGKTLCQIELYYTESVPLKKTRIFAQHE